MPPCLIEQQDGVRARRDVEGDLFEMHAHRLAIATGHDDASALALGGADRPEDPGRGPALILGGRRPSPTPRPAAGELGLLADPGFILPPQLYGCALGEAPSDLRQAGCEAFLKSAMSPGF